ncbi:MAG: ATP-binding protein [Candidatus Parabeggiatoa sp.]|nr:ATP-binding protein [Candidatus Parabeggiatoa sp.]
MSLLPSSLFGRLVLVLLTGLLLAQVLSIVILFKDQHRQKFKRQEKQLILRMTETVKILDSLPHQKREPLLVVLNTLRLRVFLNSKIDCLEGKINSPVLASLIMSLHQYLGHDRSLCFVENKPARSHHLIDRLNLFKTRFHPPFWAQIQLSDGSWVNFEHFHPQEAITTPWRLVITLTILLITVLILSLWAVRWLTRPLAILADAAEHLGRDIHHPPLSEKGPTEVRRAAHAFNLMQTRLTRYLEDRARILTAISHDLKTPITRLRLRVEQLENQKRRESFIRDLDEMESMTTATLNFMRGLEIIEPLQLLDIRALLESLQADYEDMGLPVICDYGYTPPPLSVHPQSLKRCLVNLIDNAHKYGQRVFISLKKQADHLYIIVADKGPGIPETALETVFEPFYRLEKSRNRATGGTGLGLSIARNIARAHGGDIILRNRAGGGLEAIISLPVVLQSVYYASVYRQP